MSISLPPLTRPSLFSSGPLMSGLNTGQSWILENHQEYEITTFRTRISSTFEDPVQLFVRSLKDLKHLISQINAFALSEEGNYWPFDGLEDLENRILRAVGVATERFNERCSSDHASFRLPGQSWFWSEEAAALRPWRVRSLVGKNLRRTSPYWAG